MDAMVCLREERRMDCRTAAGRPPRLLVLMKPTNCAGFSLAVLPVVHAGQLGEVEVAGWRVEGAGGTVEAGWLVPVSTDSPSSVNVENRSVCCTFAASNAVLSPPPSLSPPSSSSSSIMASPTDWRTDMRRSFVVCRVCSPPRNGDSSRSPICTSAMFHVRRRARCSLDGEVRAGRVGSRRSESGE